MPYAPIAVGLDAANFEIPRSLGTAKFNRGYNYRAFSKTLHRKPAR